MERQNEKIYEWDMQPTQKSLPFFLLLLFSLNMYFFSRPRCRRQCVRNKRSFGKEEYRTCTVREISVLTADEEEELVTASRKPIPRWKNKQTRALGEQ